MLNPALAANICTDYERLRSQVAHQIGDRALAEDIVNDALVESLEKLSNGKIADPTRFCGYVYRVALNLLRNHRRLASNRCDLRADNSVLNYVTDGASPFDHCSSESMTLRIHEAINRLPVRRDREILQRYYLQGQDRDDICRDLGVESLNFDRVAFRARRRLKAVIESYGWQFDDLSTQ